MSSSSSSSSSSSNHLLLLYLISALLITYHLCSYNEAAVLTSPDVWATEYFCDLGGTYENNTVFETNLDLLLSSLTTVTPTTAIFYDARGEDPDQVFGLAACLGDHHRDCSECLCRACLRRLALHARWSCPNKKQATVVSRGCVLSYSIESLDVDDDHRRQGLPPDDEIATIDHLEAEMITSEIGIEEAIPELAQSEPLFILMTPPEEEKVVVTAVEEEKEELPDSVVTDSDDRQPSVEIQVVENQEEMILMSLPNGTDDEALPESAPIQLQSSPMIIDDETPTTTPPLSSIGAEEAEESEDFMIIPTASPTIIPSKKTFSPPNTEAADEPILSVPAPPSTEEETEPSPATSTEEETRSPPIPLTEEETRSPPIPLTEEEKKSPPTEQTIPPQPKKMSSPSRTKRSPSPVPTTSRSSARTRRPKSKEEKKKKKKKDNNPSPVVVFKFISVIALLVIVYLLCSRIWSSNTVSKRDFGRSRFYETGVPKGWGRSTFLNRRTRKD